MILNIRVKKLTFKLNKMTGSYARAPFSGVRHHLREKPKHFNLFLLTKFSGSRTSDAPTEMAGEMVITSNDLG